MSTPSRLPPDFSRSAAYPLYAIDPATEQGLVLHFTPEDYRRASFLDERILAHRQFGGWRLPRAELETALAMDAAAMPRLQWLFHIGHCGSSLCSRMLELMPGVLGIREPLPLLTLVQHHHELWADSWRPLVLRLLARGFDETAAVVVKPTSLVSSLAGPLLKASDGGACLLWVDLQTWLATMLRDDVLRQSTLASAGYRLGDTPWQNPAEGDGPALAMLWLAEQLRWLALRSDPRLGSRLIDLDFAEVLACPADAIAGLALHYGIVPPGDLHARIEASSLLRRYAKDQRQMFDAATRARELATALEQHRDAVEAGLRWAELEIRGWPAADGSAIAPRLRPRRLTPGTSSSRSASRA